MSTLKKLFKIALQCKEEVEGKTQEKAPPSQKEIKNKGGAP